MSMCVYRLNIQFFCFCSQKRDAMTPEYVCYITILIFSLHIYIYFVVKFNPWCLDDILLATACKLQKQ